MAMLGKSLAFYMKYGIEMERLYWAPKESDKTPNVDGLEGGEKVLEMIQAVGDAACREAADFLHACREGVEQHFEPMATVTQVRRNLQQLWSLAYNLSLRDEPERGFQLGAALYPDLRAIVPWLWRSGGRRAEDAIIRILGYGNEARLMRWEAGSVALPRIPVFPEGHQGFDVDREPLIVQVQQAFAKISANQVRAIASI